MLAGVCIGIGSDTVDVLLRRVLLGWHIVLLVLMMAEELLSAMLCWVYSLLIVYRHCCCLFSV